MKTYRGSATMGSDLVVDFTEADMKENGYENPMEYARHLADMGAWDECEQSGFFEITNIMEEEDES